MRWECSREVRATWWNFSLLDIFPYFNPNWRNICLVLMEIKLTVKGMACFYSFFCCCISFKCLRDHLTNMFTRSIMCRLLTKKCFRGETWKKCKYLQDGSLKDFAKIYSKSNCKVDITDIFWKKSSQYTPWKIFFWNRFYNIYLVKIKKKKVRSIL